ncbi:hypothetical protein KPL70_020317 [Citrus sinensis]|nr:hypothetical protein KPL70_020317 [Citrus sinensis]
MAQGYLKLEGREDMELRGEKYFRNLASCSLFPDFQRNEFDVYTQKKPRSLVVEREGYFIKGIVLSEVFDQLTCLRTLDLSNHDSVWCKVIEVVPRGIKGLIHLSWRSSLRNLPQGMGKLIKLRHGENVGTPLSYMPKGIERCS